VERRAEEDGASIVRAREVVARKRRKDMLDGEILTGGFEVFWGTKAVLVRQRWIIRLRTYADGTNCCKDERRVSARYRGRSTDDHQLETTPAEIGPSNTSGTYATRC
jgi:hypothetical protein